MHRLGRGVAAGVVSIVAVVALGVQPAGAVHLFPLTPTFDPLGHDCAKALTASPSNPVARVQVAGFSFTDAITNSSTTNIVAGQSVTWTWTLDHCHSVTFSDGGGTRGGPGFMPAGQEQLVRQNGAGNNSFTMSFANAGTYKYSCVHHASVGMVGTVVVTAAKTAPSGAGASGASDSPNPAPGTTTPVTGASPLPVTGTSSSRRVVTGAGLLVAALATRRRQRVARSAVS